MKFSVVTISFNQAQYLEQAIRSVTGQRGCEIEYIVVDPGSTDGSRDIIARHARSITRCILDRDQGPADGLNKGFAAATGEIFCYLNSDDLFLPEAFAKVAAYFRRYPSCDVLVGNGYVIDAEGAFVRRVYSDRFSLRRAAYGTGIAIQPSTFFRAQAYRKAGGFNIGNRSTWDGELVVDMALAGANFRNVPDFLSCYRIHPESITGTARLAEAQRQAQLLLFRKILGRERRPFDDIVSAYFRLAKHLGNPRATYERVMRGPVYGRYRQTS